MTLTRGGARTQRTAVADQETERTTPPPSAAVLPASGLSTEKPSTASAKRSQRSRSEEHRSKRVKTENEPEAPISAEAQAPPDPSPLAAADPDGPADAPADAPAPASPEADPGYDIAALAAQAAQAAIDSIPSRQPITAYAQGKESKTDDHHDGSNRDENENAMTAPDVDFSSAPSDPTELALWVAQQISSFGEGARGSAESDSSERRRLLLHPPALYTRRYDEDDDPEKVADRERVREENRERKKRWRESNAERNKDNDLRCRINKRAKTLWGPTQSVERSAWMESEFNKRRAKRESKERVHAFDDGFPGFAFAPGFGSTLFPAPGVGPQGETNAAGLLLANALLGVGSNGAGPNAEAANALKAALEGGAVDPKPFTEALRAMAANPEIMNGINAILGGYSGFEDLSGDDEPGGVMQSTESASGARDGEGRQQSEADDEQSEIVKKLNQATAMLNELNGSNEASAGTNGFTAINAIAGLAADRPPERPDSREEETEHRLDQAQIDALLTLANGGALTGEEDGRGENQLASLAENLGQEQANGAQPDNDMSAILQRIIQQVMPQGEEKAAEESTPLPRAAVGTSTSASPSHAAHPDPFGVARNPAMALSSLLHCAGMSINTVIPAAQSHATSQLYARLSNHSRSSTPSGGGINPAHASAFGSTAAMNRKLLARPNAYSRPLHTANTTPRAGPAGPPPRLRTAEEERKARSFGYPPLPGKRMVIPRRESRA